MEDKFATLEVMYQYFWEFIYKVLEILGIEKDENGNLVFTK